MSEWKWYVGFAPSIGWDMAFQAPVDLFETMPERIKVRRPSRLDVDKQRKMHCIPWAPKFFGAVDKGSVGVISRNLFIWITEATADAAEDWDKAWEPESEIVSATTIQAENEAATLAAQARARAEMAKALKKDIKLIT